MKITMNKDVITLAEAKAAKELADDFKSWVTPDILESWANLAAGTNGWKLIKVQKMEVEKNHHQLTIWADCILQGSDGFCIVSFDVCQASGMPYGGRVDACIQRFSCAEIETVEYTMPQD